MAEYIEKAAAVSVLLYNQDECYSAVIAEMEDIPAADVAPVVHAKWIDTGERTEDEDGVYTCSACGHNDTHSPGIEVPHCWFCGAKMDGGEKPNE